MNGYKHILQKISDKKYILLTIIMILSNVSLFSQKKKHGNRRFISMSQLKPMSMVILLGMIQHIHGLTQTQILFGEIINFSRIQYFKFLNTGLTQVSLIFLLVFAFPILTLNILSLQILHFGNSLKNGFSILILSMISILILSRFSLSIPYSGITAIICFSIMYHSYHIDEFFKSYRKMMEQYFDLSPPYPDSLLQRKRQKPIP